MDPRYPIGPFAFNPHATQEQRQASVAAIGVLPAELNAAVASLPSGGLDRPYREGGWTVRQVVHHVADSHVNAYVRTRLALTEETPTIKTYDESAWAELVDARTMDAGISLQILDGLHRRWHALLRSLPPESFARPARHPDFGEVPLDFFLQMYSWHGRHHVGHVRLVR